MKIRFERQASAKEQKMGHIDIIMSKKYRVKNAVSLAKFPTNAFGAFGHVGQVEMMDGQFAWRPHFCRVLPFINKL